MRDLGPSRRLIGEGSGGPKEGTKAFNDQRKLDFLAEFLMVDRVAQALADVTIGNAASDGALVEVLVEASTWNDDGAQELGWAEQVGAAAVEKRLTLALLKMLLLLLPLLEPLKTFIRPWGRLPNLSVRDFATFFVVVEDFRTSRCKIGLDLVVLVLGKAIVRIRIWIRWSC